MLSVKCALNNIRVCNDDDDDDDDASCCTIRKRFQVFYSCFACDFLTKMGSAIFPLLIATNLSFLLLFAAALQSISIMHAKSVQSGFFSSYSLTRQNEVIKRFKFTGSLRQRFFLFKRNSQSRVLYP